MTNETVTILFDAYPTAEKFHVTSNGFAFESENDAVNHSLTLADKTILVIPKGGTIESAMVLDLDGAQTEKEDAVIADETPTNEGETGSTGEGEEGNGETAEGELAKYSKAELQKLCDEKGIEYNSKDTKAALIELLEATGK